MMDRSSGEYWHAFLGFLVLCSTTSVAITVGQYKTVDDGEHEVYMCPKWPSLSTYMNKQKNPTSSSRKRKRGKYKNTLIEGEDDAIDIVTFKEVKINTPAGKVTQRVEIPLWPNPNVHEGTSNKHKSTTPGPHNEHFQSFGLDTNWDSNDLPVNEQEKNMV